MQHPKKKAEKKRRLTGRKPALILTLVFVALAAAFVLLLPAIRQWFPAPSYAPPALELTFETLQENEREELESITVSHLEGDSYTLRYQGGHLLLEQDGALLDINDAYEEELLKAATQIAVEDVVTRDEAEVAEHLEDMGLSPVNTTVLVRYTDGRTVQIEIGAAVPETTYSYYRWSGDNGIYMCDVGISDAFALTANRLLPVSQPVLEKTLIDSLRLTKADGTVIDMVFTVDSSGNVTGRLEAPYRYPMSAERTEAVLTAISNLRLGTREAEVTDENQAEYGFDNPLCVIEVHQQAGTRAVVNTDGQLVAELAQEQALQFTIGRAQGDYFYTCEYEGSCYHVSRFLVQALADARAQELLSKNPADMGDATLAAVTVQTGAGISDIRVTRTERVLPNNQLETDENGDIVYDTTITLNGENITQQQFDALVNGLKTLAVAGNVAQDWSPGASAPRWQLSLTTVGGVTRTISAYPLDAFSDALIVDGVCMHYAYIEALELALPEWVQK